MGKAYTVFFMYTYKHTFPDPGATTTRTITRTDTISANIFLCFVGANVGLIFVCTNNRLFFFVFLLFGRIKHGDRVPLSGWSWPGRAAPQKTP